MRHNVEGYGRPARLLHWITALLVLCMIPAGLVMIRESIPRPLQDALFLFHKNIGVVVFAVMILRLVWRGSHAPASRPALPLWQERAATLNHVLLYVLLLIMPISGYIRVRAGGFPIEALDALGVPTLVARSEPLAQIAETTHFYAAWTLIALAAMHIGAAIHHAVIRKDGILARMWPPV